MERGETEDENVDGMNERIYCFVFLKTRERGRERNSGRDSEPGTINRQAGVTY